MLFRSSIVSSPATQVTAQITSVPEPPKPATTGTELQQTSEAVVAEKKDQNNSNGNVVITNVNNQTVVVAKEEYKPEPKIAITSSSVGR